MNPVARKAVAAALLAAGAAGAYLAKSGRLPRLTRSGEKVRNASSGASNGTIRVTETSLFSSAS